MKNKCCKKILLDIKNPFYYQFFAAASPSSFDRSCTTEMEAPIPFSKALFDDSEISALPARKTTFQFIEKPVRNFFILHIAERLTPRMEIASFRKGYHLFSRSA